MMDIVHVLTQRKSYLKKVYIDMFSFYKYVLKIPVELQIRGLSFCK